MAVVYHEIYLPIDTESTFDYIVIKQGDAGTHRVRATLISNNRVYTIPTSGASYFMKFRKPDNNYCLVEATVSDNTISAEVTEEMLRVSGTGLGEFMIVSGSDELKTANFHVKIVKETFTSGDVQSHSDFAPFAALLEGAGAAASNANTAAAAANAAASLAQQKAEAIPDDYSDLVAEVEEVKADLDAQVADINESLGNLSNLETESKTDLVSAINEASQSGLSDTAKRALLNCFANVPWFGGEGSEYYDALESALYENLPIIYFVRGRGTSGALVVRNEKRAMSEFIPFINEIPITIRLGLKGNAFSFIGKFANTEYGFMLDTNIKTNDGNSSGFYNEDDEYGVFAFRTSDKQFTFEDRTSHNPKFMQSALSGETVGDHFCIVLADSDDQNNPLPETPISGFLEVQGRMYKIQEEDYQVIEVVKGKGTSGQNIVDVANRALSDPIPFNNTAPITVQISLDGDAYLYNFKFTDTNNAIIQTDTVRTPNNIIGYFYDNTASVGGWGENRRPLTFKEYGTLEPSILGTSSDGQVPDGHFRLLFANANDSSGSLPEAPISGVVTVQGIKYKLTTSD